MLTINDLRDQFEIQGYIEVKSFDDMGEDERTHFSGNAEELSAGEDIANKEILFMYVDRVGTYNTPAIVIEIVR